jgi:hypothetical protein
VLTREGFGRPADAARAYYWFTLSELQGGEIAKQTVGADLRALNALLSESDRTRMAGRRPSESFAYDRRDGFEREGRKRRVNTAGRSSIGFYVLFTPEKRNFAI